MAALPIAATLTPFTGSVFLFHGWKGWVDDKSPIIEFQTRTGQTGTVAQQIGIHSEPTECTGIRYEQTIVGMRSFATAAAAMASPTPAVLVDPFGRSIRVRIYRTVVTPMRVRGPVDGSTQTQYQITVNMTVDKF